MSTAPFWYVMRKDDADRVWYMGRRRRLPSWTRFYSQARRFGTRAAALEACAGVWSSHQPRPEVRGVPGDQVEGDAT